VEGVREAFAPTLSFRAKDAPRLRGVCTVEEPAVDPARASGPSPSM